MALLECLEEADLSLTPLPVQIIKNVGDSLIVRVNEDSNKQGLLTNIIVALAKSQHKLRDAEPACNIRIGLLRD